MGRKKKRVHEEPKRIFCWYCDRDFNDESVLVTHQKNRHFKCSSCGKRLQMLPGLVIHCQQLHKETIEKVPNAIEGRDSLEIQVYGMEGVPEQDDDAKRMRGYGPGMEGEMGYNPHQPYPYRTLRAGKNLPEVPGGAPGMGPMPYMGGPVGPPGPPGPPGVQGPRPPHMQYSGYYGGPPQSSPPPGPQHPGRQHMGRGPPPHGHEGMHGGMPQQGMMSGMPQGMPQRMPQGQSGAGVGMPPGVPSQSRPPGMPPGNPHGPQHGHYPPQPWHGHPMGGGQPPYRGPPGSYGGGMPPAPYGQGPPPNMYRSWGSAPYPPGSDPAAVDPMAHHPQGAPVMHGMVPDGRPPQLESSHEQAPSGDKATPEVAKTESHLADAKVEPTAVSNATMNGDSKAFDNTTKNPEQTPAGSNAQSNVPPADGEAKADTSKPETKGEENNVGEAAAPAATKPAQSAPMYLVFPLADISMEEMRASLPQYRVQPTLENKG